VHSFGAACWAKDEDIATDEVIRACLEGAGFDAGLADSGLLTGAETFASNLEEAVSRGVFWGTILYHRQGRTPVGPRPFGRS